MRDLQYLSNIGNPDLYSPGLDGLTTSEELYRRLQALELMIDEVSKDKDWIKEKETGAWFILNGSELTPRSTMMLGAICGDVAGSVYEHQNTHEILSPERLIRPDTRITDDSVMTLAVADGIRRSLVGLGENWMKDPRAERVIKEKIRSSLMMFGRLYPNAGYGGTFRQWIQTLDPQPYYSWGNGSAMRASYCGWCANTLEEAECLAELSAAVTHNHREGIMGAKVVAGAIFLLRSGKKKGEILRYVNRFYRMDFTLAQIRPTYRFDVSCQGSVPQAIEAFLEGTNFEEVIALAISIGGDSDTIAAIAGSLAEVIYPISDRLRHQAVSKMDGIQRKTYQETVDFAFRFSNI